MFPKPDLFSRKQKGGNLSVLDLQNDPLPKTESDFCTREFTKNAMEIGQNVPVSRMVFPVFRTAITVYSG